MANNSNKVFVSPGVYTSEKDLTFVSQSVGVTTLGLAGETLKGPAFESVLITDFDEFRTYFGSTSPKKDSNNNPKYELPYIAKSYLEESNQLFVSRVLGLTGYKPKKSFGIKTIASVNFDPTETPLSFPGGTISYEPGGSIPIDLIELSGKTATDGTSIFDYITEGAPYNHNDWFTIGLVPSGETSSLTGTSLSSPIGEYNNQNWWNNFFLESMGGSALISYLFIYDSGATEFNVTKYVYTGATTNDYGDITVALLRSRGSYTSETLNLEVTGNTSVTIDSEAVGTSGDLFGDPDYELNFNPFSEFTLNVTGSTSGSKTFTCSLDTSSSSYITKVLGVDVFDKTKSDFPLYVYEVYPELLNELYEKGLIRGLSTDVVYHSVDDDFLSDWDTPKSPMVVSEVRGGTVDDLFEVYTISDGDAANQHIKITILNIDLESLEFDVLVRDYNDTDDNMVVLERFSRCTMNSSLPGYIARKIGTSDGEYELRSRYIMLSMVENHPEDSIPSGFKGFPTDTLSGTTLGGIQYKTEFYSAGDFTDKYEEDGEPIYASRPDRSKRASLGLSSDVEFDNHLFNFKGTGYDKVTTGFHLSTNASSITGNTITGYMFDCTPYDLEGTDKGVLDSESYRKFTFAVAGGFDGWDIYRSVRTNTDGYVFSNKVYISGNTDNNGVFSTTTGNSDYYAYLEAIEIFDNPEAIDINLFATPGLNFKDHNSLVTETIDMIENDRADSFYFINAPNISTVDEIVDEIDLANLDTSYAGTYWPWIQVRDNINSTQLYISPTAEIVKNAALTDNIAYPWYAFAGYSRGLVSSIKARKKLTLDDRDVLYKNRINPIATFSDTGTINWGNKTLQVRESALDRISIRRLLLRARKLISAVAVRLLFEQNDEQVREEFLRLVNPILESIKKERGLTDFRVSVSNDPEDIDANTLRGKIYIKPSRPLEYIDLEFIITPTGASFEDV